MAPRHSINSPRVFGYMSALPWTSNISLPCFRLPAFARRTSEMAPRIYIWFLLGCQSRLSSILAWAAFVKLSIILLRYPIKTSFVWSRYGFEGWVVNVLAVGFGLGFSLAVPSARCVVFRCVQQTWFCCPPAVCLSRQHLQVFLPGNIAGLLTQRWWRVSRVSEPLVPLRWDRYVTIGNCGRKSSNTAHSLCLGRQNIAEFPKRVALKIEPYSVLLETTNLDSRYFCVLLTDKKLLPPWEA